jgi:hypothetical protein
VEFGGEEAFGLALLVAAGLAIWRFGFWWGIAIVGGGFALLTFVQAINLIPPTDPPAAVKTRQTPVLARLHAAASAFLSGVIGFGVAAVIGAGVSAGPDGILAAAAMYTALDQGIGWLLDLDWGGALGSWCLLMLAYLAIGIPLSAYLAPGYTASGMGANIGVTLLMSVAGWLVLLASPWRTRWSATSSGDVG